MERDRRPDQRWKVGPRSQTCESSKDHLALVWFQFLCQHLPESILMLLDGESDERVDKEVATIATGAVDRFDDLCGFIARSHPRR